MRPALAVIFGAIAFTACSSAELADVGVREPQLVEDPVVEAPVAEAKAEGESERERALGLAERAGPRHETTGDVPHIQLDAALDPAIDAELRRRAFLLPGIEEVESVRSLPGAAGLWISGTAELARGDVLGGSRELAHIHPDGSLHVFLPVSVAIEVDRTKWGELHPWVLRDGFWEGVTMVYTPETADELDVVIQILVASYNFITGSDLTPSDIA